jgi:small nuclear ribonucleoprotein (snRNP)-like protein
MGGKMSVSIITRKINARTVTIKLVDGSVVHGKINLHRSDIDITRVSDLFTKVSDPFIVVFDATAEGKGGRVLVLNKNNVVWVSPEDEPRQADKPPQEEKPKEPSGGSLLDRLRST